MVDNVQSPLIRPETIVAEGVSFEEFLTQFADAASDGRVLVDGARKGEERAGRR